MMDNSKKIIKKWQIENTPANNLLMLLGAAFVALLLVSFIDGNIVRTKLMSAKGYNSSLRNNFQKAFVENRELKAAQASNAVLEKQFNQLLSTIPKNTRIDDVLESITKIGTNLGLKIVFFKPQDVIKSDFSTQTPISIAVLGDYNHMAQFISDVANLPYLLTIKDFDITRENPTASNLAMRMTIIVVQYQPPSLGGKA
jgi:type IV pilus assembly protein PilO